MIKKSLSILLAMIIVFTAFNGCIKAEKKTIEGKEPVFDYGNTSGNHSNYGLAAMQGEWVYARIRTNISECLYKMRTDGTEKVLVWQGDCNYINAVGEWIYAIDGTNRIRRIRNDGKSEPEMLLFDMAFDNIYIVDDWIYYIDYDDTGVYRIRTDGRGKKRLVKGYVSDFCVAENRLYYSGMEAGFYSISTDGKGKTKLTDEKAITINVVDGWIYYSSERGGIWKVRTDGTKKTEVTGDLVDQFNVAGDWIYYTNISDNSYLYKIRTDGTGKILLNREQSFNFCIIGEWIFFRSIDTDIDNTYKIRTDGTRKQLA